MTKRVSTTGGKVARAALTTIFALTALPAASAGYTTPKSAPVARAPYITQAPIVMLKDMETGEILFSRGADKRFAPASMAKVMTAYVVLDLIKKGQLSRETLFTVDEATWKKWSTRPAGSSMFLRAGEKVSVDDLLKGLITVSGNDAASALAVGIDGSEEAFINRMNAVAIKIKMTSSNFGTPSGWPDGGATKVSAGDLIILADRLIRDHPDGYARYFSIPKLQHGVSPDGKPIVQSNRNPILGRFVGADGLKTGHTSEAGYCFLGSAKRDGRRLVMVVAGLPSDNARREEAKRLMSWGFEQRAPMVAAQANRGNPSKGRKSAATP